MFKENRLNCDKTSGLTKAQQVDKFGTPSFTSEGDPQIPPRLNKSVTQQVLARWVPCLECSLVLNCWIQEDDSLRMCCFVSTLDLLNGSLSKETCSRWQVLNVQSCGPLCTACPLPLFACVQVTNTLQSWNVTHTPAQPRPCLDTCRLCKLRKVPYGYGCTGNSTTQLAGRGSVFFCTLGEGEGSPSPPGSPMVGAMSHGTSLLSLHASSASDSELGSEPELGDLGRDC